MTSDCVQPAGQGYGRCSVASALQARARLHASASSAAERNYAIVTPQRAVTSQRAEQTLSLHMRGVVI